MIDADDELHDDLSAGYDQWIELFKTGLAAMRRRGELRPTPTRATWRYRLSSRTRAVRC